MRFIAYSTTYGIYLLTEPQHLDAYRALQHSPLQHPDPPAFFSWPRTWFITESGRMAGSFLAPFTGCWIDLTLEPTPTSIPLFLAPCQGFRAYIGLSTPTHDNIYLFLTILSQPESLPA